MYWIKIKVRYILQVLLLTLIALRKADSSADFYRHFPSSIPSFLPVPTNITVHEGETAHLRCRIHNLGTKMVMWRKTTDEFPLTVGKRKFTPDRSIEIETEVITDKEAPEDRYDLILNDVKLKQAGIYECQVSATEHYSQHYNLRVMDREEYKQELTLHGTEYVSVFENVHLVCNATGSTMAPDGVDWFFNGDIITETKPQWKTRLVKLSKKPFPGRSLISELIIENATKGDSGHYVCRLTRKLAKGLEVYVLNDRKNYREPKRDMNPENQETSDSLPSTYNSGPPMWNCYILYITTIIFFFKYTF